MKIEKKSLERRFVFGQQTFPDPLPTGTVLEVQQILAQAEPKIGTAIPVGPETKDGVQFYTFTQSVGTKG